MLLAIDVGNTNITAGLFRGDRLVRRGRIGTPVIPAKAGIDMIVSSSKSLIEDLDPRPRSSRGQAFREDDVYEIASELLHFLKVSVSNLNGVIVSSVVPRVTLYLKRSLKMAGCPKPLILGENVWAPIKNRYRVPSQVGQDRLVNGVAVCFLYRAPAVVVDFGTAVTVDLVSQRCEYLGGLIVPGVGVALEALVSRAALLPEIELSPPREFLGRDTRQSMRAGLFYGYGALCDGLVSRMKARYAPSAKVIATGGHCRLIAPYCRTIQIVDPDLTLRGLRFIFEKLPKKP